MEKKTQIHAEDGKQELTITREFDLPLELLFKAYEEAEIVEQWMGTKVLKLENRKHGSYQFETIDPKGNKHGFNGVIHEFIPNNKITRTFEMEGAAIGPQLEFLEFEKLSDNRSKLTMQVIYRSVEARAIQLSMPFEMGINMAHDRIEEIQNEKFKNI
nr:SRPBCC domain-containing protein [uncultured Fluviicola sp.]